MSGPHFPPIYEPETGKLALCAGVPQDDPPISRTLIRRCALDQDAFAWFLDDSGEVSQSIQRHQIRSGMYVPLVAAWRGPGLRSHQRGQPQPLYALLT